MARCGETWQPPPEQLASAPSEAIWSSSSSSRCTNPRVPFHVSSSSSCASNGVLHEEEEEVVKSGEQPQLLEQRHHHGLLQPARRGAAQRDTHTGEWGTNRWHTDSISVALHSDVEGHLLFSQQSGFNEFGKQQEGPCTISPVSKPRGLLKCTWAWHCITTISRDATGNKQKQNFPGGYLWTLLVGTKLHVS